MTDPKQCLMNDVHNGTTVTTTIYTGPTMHVLKLVQNGRDEPDSQFYLSTDRVSLMRLRDLIDGVLEPKTTRTERNDQ